MIYGYHRISTKQQHLDRGISEIEDYCKISNLPLKKIYTDRISGKTFDRPRYIVLKEDVLRHGDTLIITELDRLGRNKNAILNELEYFRNKGIRMMILELPTTLQDYSKMNNSMAQMVIETINSILIDLYAAMAQAEMEKREKRQREGIEAKMKRGDWENYGRPRIMEPENFNEVYNSWKNGNITAVQAIKMTGLKKTTFYNMVKRKEKSK